MSTIPLAVNEAFVTTERSWANGEFSWDFSQSVNSISSAQYAVMSLENLWFEMIQIANVVLVFQGKGLKPNWVEEVAPKLRELISLPENWDSYGAKPINPNAAESALKLLSSIMATYAVATPALIPRNRGGLQLEWNSSRLDLEIKIDADGTCRAYCQDYESDQESVFAIAHDYSNLQPLVSKLPATEITHGDSSGNARVQR